jgi:hypothetical protein
MTRAKRGCGHRGLLTYESALVFVPTTTGIPANAGTTTVPGQHRCNRCGAVVPLGEAYDAPDEVAREMDAADIAARYADEKYTPGADRFDWCPEFEDRKLCNQCETLYLVHVITRHDVEYASRDHDRITEHGND